MLDTTNKNIPAAKDLPAVTQDILNAVLEKHAMFLRGQIGGKRAILQYKDLSQLTFHNHDLSQADFTGSKMVRADLSLGTYRSACFYNCDLREANMSHANLSRADMRGVCLSGANLSGADLHEADLREGKIMEKARKGELVNRVRSDGESVKTLLTGARLTHANLSRMRAQSADFSDADLSQAKIRDADFKEASFCGANLSNTDFTGSTLTKSDMKHAIMAGTILESTENFGMDRRFSVTGDIMGETVEDTGKTLEGLLQAHMLWIESAGKQGEQINFTGYDLRNVGQLYDFPLTAIVARGATFLGQDLHGIALQSAVLDDADFRDCFMEDADLRGSSLRNCKMARISLAHARLSPLQFKKKDGSVRLSRTDLSGSDLRYGNLEGADLRDAIMMGVDLSGANLMGTDLRRADLTGANLKNASLENALLDGAIFEDT